MKVEVDTEFLNKISVEIKTMQSFQYQQDLKLNFLKKRMDEFDFDNKAKEINLYL